MLGTMHPSGIVDTLHVQCSNMVVAQNKLKKKASQNECPERKDDKDGTLSRKGDNSPVSDTNATTTSKTSRLQLMVSLSRVCIIHSLALFYSIYRTDRANLDKYGLLLPMVSAK